MYTDKNYADQQQATENKYLVYSYEDKENKVGCIGIAIDLKEVKPVSYFSNMQEPSYVWSDLNQEDAFRISTKTYRDYISKGWKMLNNEKDLVNFGVSARNWTVDIVKRLIDNSGIEYFNDFLKTFPNAYQSARANGWLKDLNLKYINKPRGYWTEERIIETMNSFDSLIEFSSTMPGVYHTAIRMGIDMSHLKTRNTLPKGYWTEERVIQAAESCETLSEFRKIKRAYTIALETGLINSFTWLSKTFNYYTEEEAIEEAKKYKSWTEFRNNNRSVCDWCKRRNMEFPWFPPKKERKSRTSKNKADKEDI
jgi:hypothetical protein